jgi:MFS transporter, CP family, cyanate transporter
MRDGRLSPVPCFLYSLANEQDLRWKPRPAKCVAAAWEKRPTMKAASNSDAISIELPQLLCLLWLIGVSMRVTMLAVPPVIPLIHDDLAMSQAQTGLLMSVPLMVFAIAAIPGALFVVRFGSRMTLITGLLIAGLAGAARGSASSLGLLYAATAVMSIGIAIMQPALPTLVREWLPKKVGVGSAVSTNGMLVGTTLGPALSAPLVLPLVGESWRHDLVVWALPLFATVALVLLVRSPAVAALVSDAGFRRWWPDWRSSLPWKLGIAFGGNNSIYFTANTFIPDYLRSHGHSDLVGLTLTLLNGAQLLASFLLMVRIQRIQERAWPYLAFGALSIAALVGMASLDGYWITASAGLLGFSLAVTLVLMLAAPPALSPPGEVHRVAAGMFTIAYSCGVLIPFFCGKLWDLTGAPWIAFVPLIACAVIMTGVGVALSRHPRPA